MLIVDGRAKSKLPQGKTRRGRRQAARRRNDATTRGLDAVSSANSVHSRLSVPSLSFSRPYIHRRRPPVRRYTHAVCQGSPPARDRRPTAPSTTVTTRLPEIEFASPSDNRDGLADTAAGRPALLPRRRRRRRRRRVQKSTCYVIWHLATHNTNVLRRVRASAAAAVAFACSSPQLGVDGFPMSHSTSSSPRAQSTPRIF